MKTKILLSCLLSSFLVGCATPMTSGKLMEDADKACKSETTQEKQYYCMMGYVAMQCEYKMYDVKLCGKLNK